MKRLLMIWLLLQGTWTGAVELETHHRYDLKPAAEPGSTQWMITLSHFEPRDWGNVFFFVDIMGERGGGLSEELAYFELSTEFNLPVSGAVMPDWLHDIRFHVELDDSDVDYINRRFLFGLTFDIRPDFMDQLDLEILHSSEEHVGGGNIQLTLVWMKSFPMGSRELVLRGFADYWQSGDNDGNHHMTLLCQPQIVLRFTKRWSVGMELEISNNFYAPDYSCFNKSVFLSYRF